MRTKRTTLDIGEIASNYNTMANTGARTEKLSKFNAKQGHGFAAELCNDLCDKISGKDAVILGDDNAKNGADRMVGTQLIQTKYCKTAAESINAGFNHEGQYRYLDSQGKPMQMEIPKDQYEHGIGLMRKKIEEGRVPGVTNPDDAEKLVRKGHVTYKQAVQVAKFGTIESLTFDAINGVVIGGTAFGISTLIVLAKEVWSGESANLALEKALYSGIQTGGVAFVSCMLSAQLTRTGLNTILLTPSIETVKLLPSSVRHLLVNAFRDGANIYGGVATNNLAKLLRGNIIAGTALTLVISTPQCIEMFRGRISAAQLFKTVMTTASSITGGTLGAMLGSTMGPIGAVIGSFLGGSILGTSVKTLVDEFIEDDAVKMIRILEEIYPEFTETYMISEEEHGLILTNIRTEMEKGALLAMFASDDRAAFARKLIEVNMQEVISWRCHIYLPKTEEVVGRMGGLVEKINNGDDVSYLTERHKVDTKEMSRQLLGREISQEAADKAWYVTKQMQGTLVQTDILLEDAYSDEAQYKLQLEDWLEERKAIKAQLKGLYNEK